MNDLTLTKAKLSTNDSKKQSFESLTDNLAFTKNVVIFFNSSKVSTIKSTSIHFGITEEKVINILTKEIGYYEWMNLSYLSHYLKMI